jgi:hypothetical protein
MGNTVFILGAGASNASDFNLPAMVGFFSKDHLGRQYPNLRKFLSSYSPPRTPLKKINMEDVITHLEISLEKYAQLWGEEHNFLRLCYQELLTYIKERLEIPALTACNYHSKLYNRLTDQDSVLSLNYDLVFDQVISSGPAYTPTSFLGRSFSLIGASSEYFSTSRETRIIYENVKTGVYIKLHGSINWVYCPNQICLNHQKFEACYPSYHRSHTVQPGDPCTTCGSPLQTVIVMPTMKKSFEKYPKLGFLWEIALSKLKTASVLILIGTSLAPSDYYLNWLLKESTITQPCEKLVVVNRDRKAALQAKKVIRAQRTVWYKDFQEWADGANEYEDL